MSIWKFLIILSLVFNTILSVFGFIVWKHPEYIQNNTEILGTIPPIPYQAPSYPEATSTPFLNSTTTLVTDNSIEDSNSPALFKMFTDLVMSVHSKNTEFPSIPVSITGDPVADDVINTLAEDVGYIRQPVATNTLVYLEGQKVQSEVQSAWLLLKSQALLENIRLGIVSGYRSPEAQRSLFIKYFKNETAGDKRKAYTTKEIRAGLADATIIRTLTYTAPPGYSRHHTGYTIDIRDINSGLSFYEFSKTKGFRWMAKNNYENTLKFGFIPSYPRGERDAEPEPWEFIYVGPEKIETLNLE